MIMILSKYIIPPLHDIYYDIAFRSKTEMDGL